MTPLPVMSVAMGGAALQWGRARSHCAGFAPGSGGNLGRCSWKTAKICGVPAASCPTVGSRRAATTLHAPAFHHKRRKTQARRRRAQGGGASSPVAAPRDRRAARSPGYCAPSSPQRQTLIVAESFLHSGRHYGRAARKADPTLIAALAQHPAVASGASLGRRHHEPRVRPQRGWQGRRARAGARCVVRERPRSAAPRFGVTAVLLLLLAPHLATHRPPAQ